MDLMYDFRRHIINRNTDSDVRLLPIGTMSGPTYRWSCLNCGSINDPATDCCAICAFPAFATGRDIEQYRSGTPADESPQGQKPKSTSWWVLFPEILFAVPLVAYSPFWAIQLASSGHPFLSAVWCTTAIAGTLLFFRYVRQQRAATAYVVVISILLVAVVILSYV